MAGALQVKRLPCRVERIERLSHDVMGLYLRLPPAESFDFKPGQYLDVCCPKGRRRSFSIASPPHDARPLELHVRRAPGGEFSEQVFAEDMRGAVLHLEGPLGRSIYRETASREAPPMLLIGGGTGIAPLKSILRHVLENGLPRQDDAVLGRAHRARSVRACLSGRGGPARRRTLALCARSLRALAGLGRTPRTGARGGARRHRSTRAITRST